MGDDVNSLVVRESGVLLHMRYGVTGKEMLQYYCIHRL